MNKAVSAFDPQPGSGCRDWESTGACARGKVFPGARLRTAAPSVGS